MNSRPTWGFGAQMIQMFLRLFFLAGLILSWTGCGGVSEPPRKRIDVVARPAAALTNVAEEWAIRFEDRPRGAAGYELSAIIGCGCAVLDFDRNGLLDVLFVAEDSDATNVALFSQESVGQFRECSEAMGLKELAGAGIAVGDMNNDGWPDLYITSGRANSLWLNKSGKEFSDVTSASGLLSSGWGTSACWLDYDRDGWLDLFVTNYVDYQHRECTRLGGGDADFCTPGLFPPTSDKLFRNSTGESPNGLPLFRDVSADTGISQKSSAGLGVTALDWNGDQWVDIYVASDQHPNLLWINQQGSFTEEAAIYGCDVDFQGRAQGSMGLALGHFNDDGIEDLVVSNLDGESHAVYCRADNGFCTDRCRETGILTATRPLTGFGIAATDFDLDGVSELLTVNGRVKRQGGKTQSKDDFWWPYQQEIQLLKATVSGGKWEAMEVAGGKTHVARGLAIGDLDRDGDPDAIISTTGEPVIVLRNDFAAVRRGIALQFVDPMLGRRSCPGVVFSVQSASGISSSHTFQPCQSYMSSHADEFYMAMPQGEATLKLSVKWPHGEQRAEEFLITPAESGVTVIERGQGSLSH
jgi:enediyne biosynthesis protein E4